MHVCHMTTQGGVSITHCMIAVSLHISATWVMDGQPLRAMLGLRCGGRMVIC